MVEPVSAILTGIALVKSATSFIKENINTVKDISGIAKQIDQIFEGQQQINKQRNKEANSTANELGLSNVADTIVSAKLAQEQINEVKLMINMRFPVSNGPSTWDQILIERKRRIDEIKQRKLLARKQKIQKQKEMMDVARQASIGIGIVFTIVFLCIITYVAFAEEIDTAECMVFKPKYYMICMNESYDRALIEQHLDILEYKSLYITVPDKEE